MAVSVNSQFIRLIKSATTLVKKDTAIVCVFFQNRRVKMTLFLNFKMISELFIVVKVINHSKGIEYPSPACYVADIYGRKMWRKRF